MFSVASFFAGVGGIDLGFQQAEFEIAFANEIDKDTVIKIAKSAKKCN